MVIIQKRDKNGKATFQCSYIEQFVRLILLSISKYRLWTVIFLSIVKTFTRITEIVVPFQFDYAVTKRTESIRCLVFNRIKSIDSGLKQIFDAPNRILNCIIQFVCWSVTWVCWWNPAISIFKEFHLFWNQISSIFRWKCYGSIRNTKRHNNVIANNR